VTAIRKRKHAFLEALGALLTTSMPRNLVAPCKFDRLITQKENSEKVWFSSAARGQKGEATLPTDARLDAFSRRSSTACSLDDNNSAQKIFLE
jgi:hypothetical protein